MVELSGKRLPSAGRPSLYAAIIVGLATIILIPVSVSLTATVFPVFVSPEVREREPVRHLHSVLVLRGNGFASQEGEHYRNGRSGGGRGQNATRFENGDMIILLDWCELR